MTTVINIYEVSCHIMTASCHLCVTKMLTLHDKTTLPTFVSFVHRQFKIHSLKEKVRSRSIHIPVVRGCRVLTICARTTELGKTWKLEQEKETETRFSCRKSVCVGRRFAFQVTLYKLLFLFLLTAICNLKKQGYGLTDSGPSFKVIQHNTYSITRLSF